MGRSNKNPMVNVFTGKITFYNFTPEEIRLIEKWWNKATNFDADKASIVCRRGSELLFELDGKYYLIDTKDGGEDLSQNVECLQKQ